MIFTTARNNAAMVARVELFRLWDVEDITNEAFAALLPDKPGRWGFGFADCYVKVAGTIKAELGADGTAYPVIRRRHGFLRWRAKEGV